MFPGDGDPGLTDDNERAIAILRIAQRQIESDWIEMCRKYIDAQAAMEEQLAALEAEIERREANRAHGSDDHGQGEGNSGRVAEGDRHRQLPQ
jgi:transposase